jgi:hypothetical protein
MAGMLERNSVTHPGRGEQDTAALPPRTTSPLREGSTASAPAWAEQILTELRAQGERLAVLERCLLADVKHARFDERKLSNKSNRLSGAESPT